MVHPWEGRGSVAASEEYVEKFRADLDRVLGLRNELLEEYVAGCFSGGGVRGWSAVLARYSLFNDGVDEL